jgi:hypothetical protein
MITTLAAAALLAAATPTFAQVKEQGLGIFLQGGYVYQTTYTGNATFDSTPQGFIAGVGFGGNKSGAFGVGVDLNYMWTNNSDADQKSQTLDIPGVRPFQYRRTQHEERLHLLHPGRLVLRRESVEQDRRL